MYKGRRCFSAPSAESQDEMQGRFFRDVVVWQGSPVLKLLSGKDETLLIGRDTFLVLDLGLDVFNRVRGLHIQSDCLSGESLYEYLHTAAQSEYQVDGWLLLDVVIR